ncbi:stalk domain-containing protein [Tumebacillus sp. DT12]|uniref:Stalk domain-containing protein n=1 Tax=Tumebacillus lacus TaxID=2995335 RepID=A0ABT3WXV6_9BACL|nr:stalk domain-containing protein [Tumebacillus lacus]MCX7569510.1 stalk domain-containing protein [Tumebacillus lacus]
MLKRAFSLLFVTLLTITSPVPVSAQVPIGVLLDYEVQTYDQPPLLVEGTTLVPMRGIFESLGAEVKWDGINQKVIATKRNTTVELQIGVQTAIVNGISLTLAEKPQLVNGRTLVPLRFVSEALGAEVEWDGETRVVWIVSAEQRLLSSMRVGDLETFESLLHQGSVELGWKNETGFNLLHFAVEYGAEKPVVNEMMRTLLKKGVDPDLQTRGGVTPLMTAIVSGNEEAVDILLDAEADIHVKDNNGRTALWLAAAHDHGSIVTALKQRGDTETRTPSVADAQTEEEIIEILHYYVMPTILSDGTDPDIGAMLQLTFLSDELRDEFMKLSMSGKKQFVVQYVQDHWGDLPHDRIWDVLVTDYSQWLIGTDVRYGMNPEDAKISDFVHGDAQ